MQQEPRFSTQADTIQNQDLEQDNEPLLEGQFFIEEERGGPATSAQSSSQEHILATGSESPVNKSLSNESVEKQSLRSSNSQSQRSGKSSDINSLEDKGQMLDQTWELWSIFIMKWATSIMFLIDDLTFLVFCQYEFKMTQQDAGILFCVSAMFLFAYGLTISGYLIDKLGIKYSLIIGYTSLMFAKLVLTFADSLNQLYIVMCTLSPFGISILFPCQVLGIKKLTNVGPVRNLSFSMFYAFMVLGAMMGGPIVDFIRRDIGKTQFEYLHTNVETGKIEKRYVEISAWRTICFFGFLLNCGMLLMMAFYKQSAETQYNLDTSANDELNRASCMQIFIDCIRDRKFWRFLLFSFVIVGSKMVFSLLFFMIPKMITQEDGENAPFGIYVAIAPMLIIVFLFFLAPIQATYPPYQLILAGTSIATLGPIPMFFGMNIIQFLLFIVIVSFSEALYAPMINVFTFNFTKEGREGTFLTLTSAPVYFTMALTGIVGGYLLENFYPAVEDATHKRQPHIIWLTIIAFSAVSTLILYIGRDYFNCKDIQVPTSSEDDIISITTSEKSRTDSEIIDQRDQNKGVDTPSSFKEDITLANTKSVTKDYFNQSTV